MPIALKREDGGPGRSIKNEVSVQSQVCQLSPILTQTLVPQCLGLLDNQNARWDHILPLLPDTFEKCNAMISEKIEPVSANSQKLLIGTYCPEEMRDDISASRQNQHCLVRIYLGRRRLLHQTRGKRFFSLRNFPLHADQAEELDLPCERYAKAMAEALATLHWAVGTDAADVEFVLGAPRDEAPKEGYETLFLGQHALWVLDFDCSRPIQANDAGLTAIARSFWRNDPYYPRPHRQEEHDQKLWEVFAAEYRRVGVEIVQRRKEEDVDFLSGLVHGAITRIEETKGQF